MIREFNSGDTVEIKYDDGTLVKVVLGKEGAEGVFSIPHLNHMINVYATYMTGYTVTLLEKNLPPRGTPIRGRTKSGNPFLGFVVTGGVTGAIFFEGVGPEVFENIRSTEIASWEVIK